MLSSWLCLLYWLFALCGYDIPSSNVYIPSSVELTPLDVDRGCYALTNLYGVLVYGFSPELDRHFLRILPRCLEDKRLLLPSVTRLAFATLKWQDLRNKPSNL